MNLLSRTWSRFWSTPVFFTAIPVFSTAMFLFGATAMLSYRATTSLVISSFLLFLVAAVALSGLVAVCGSASEGGKPTWRELGRGVRQYFWRVAGLFVLLLVLAAVLSMVVLILSIPFLATGFRPGQSLGSVGLARQIAVTGLAMAQSILACALPAMYLEKATAFRAFGFGLSFLRRRFTTVASIVVVGGLAMYVLPWLVNAAPGLLSSGGALVVGLLLSVYSKWIAVLTILGLFIAYQDYSASQKPQPAYVVSG